MAKCCAKKYNHLVTVLGLYCDPIALLTGEQMPLKERRKNGLESN